MTVSLVSGGRLFFHTDAAQTTLSLLRRQLLGLRLASRLRLSLQLHVLLQIAPQLSPVADRLDTVLL